jgi:hypothetical protein
MRISVIVRWILLAFVGSISTTAQAVLIPHVLVLQTVGPGFLDRSDEPCGPPIIPGTQRFGCNIPPGTIFIGRFSLDDSILAMEGDELQATVHDFFLRFGDILYDQNDPLSDFTHFSGPLVDVHGGVLTGFRGAVSGYGDINYIEFHRRDTFRASDEAITYGGRMIFGRAQVIPEPATLAILAIGLAGLAFSRRQVA